MKLGWILQKTLLENGTFPSILPSELEALGTIVHVSDCGRFDDNLSPQIPHDSPAMFWSALGSLHFIKNISKVIPPRYLVHTFFTNELHYYSRYQSQIPMASRLNKRGFMLPFSACEQIQASEIKQWVQAPIVHIRPDNALKIAEASQVELNEEDWNRWLHQTKSLSGASASTTFWFFPAQKIEAEYRFVIANGTPISATPYPHCINDLSIMDSAVPREAFSLASSVASTITLDDPIYVMDIARNEDHFFVVELNCMATSGWYNLPVRETAGGLHRAFLRTIQSFGLD
jgi:hypothetical protein